MKWFQPVGHRFNIRRMQHFNRPLRIAIQCACVLIGTASPASAQKKPPSTQYFEQEVPASNPLRAEQAKELDSYILQMKRTDDRLREVFKPDYSSP
ncbi:MAG TPA: hypothetical protein VIM11_05085, partial [Tepidisphaeraceae bacterium]